MNRTLQSRALAILAILAVLLTAPVVPADEEPAEAVPAQAEPPVVLVLHDFQTLEGVFLEQEEDLYLLTLASDQILPLPMALVREVRRAPDDAESFAEQEDPSPNPVEPPPATIRPLERLRSFADMPDAGRSTSTFSQGPVVPHWELTHYIDRKPFLDDLDSSSWSASPVNPHWELGSGFDGPGDVSTLPTTPWSRPPLRPDWAPTDGVEDDDR